MDLLTPEASKVQHIAITATLWVCVAHGIGSVLEVLLIFRPLAAQWDPNITGACGNQTASFMAIEILGLALDVIILGQPIPMLLRLHINKKKLGLFLMFEAGAL